MSNKVSKDEQKVIRFVGVTFDENYKKGQEELNRIIGEGYKIVQDYRTESGIVFSLVMKRHEQKNAEQTTLDGFTKRESSSKEVQRY